MAACFKVMRYNGDVERRIWLVSALSSVTPITPNGGIWNESICAVSNLPAGSKENHKKTVGTVSGVPEKNICRALGSCDRAL